MTWNVLFIIVITSYRPSFYPLPLFLETFGSYSTVGQHILCSSAKAVDLIFSWRSLSPCMSSRKIWVFGLHALFWAIWKERNWRVFDNHYRGSLFSLGVFFISLTSLSNCDSSFSAFSFESFRCNLWSILFSHEKDHEFSLLIKFSFIDKKKRTT